MKNLPLLLLALFLFNVSILEASASSKVKIRHVYLTFQHEPTHSITINIQGIRTPTPLTVYFDTISHDANVDQYDHKVSGTGKKIDLPDGRKIYHIELTDLKPNTSYYFVIGTESSALTKEISFKTFPGEGKLKFIEGGDWESTTSAEALALQAAVLNPNAVFLGGDYPSYVIGKEDYQRWDAWLDTYSQTMHTQEGHLIPMVMAIGNHEVQGGFGKTKEDVPFFLTYFKQGEGGNSYFSLPLGQEKHLFVLDSGHAASHDGEQLLWLKRELKKVESKKIKIALYHVPLYPSIRFAEKNALYFSLYGIVETFTDKASALKLFSHESFQGRKYWLPLFDRYRLTVAFEHHDQTLKRTKLLKEGKEDKNGTLYLGDGGWGAEYQYFPIQGYFNSYFAKLLGKVHFFWLVEIQNDFITYSAIDCSGKVIDRFIQKVS